MNKKTTRSSESNANQSRSMIIATASKGDVRIEISKDPDGRFIVDEPDEAPFSGERSGECYHCERRHHHPVTDMEALAKLLRVAVPDELIPALGNIFEALER